ncbi:hypothetical protein SPHINGO8AM_250008 [Sphingomonas sp. 8AM]|nr:hypothetical protein SPHINGO8AM_250008 [Sphingomonas sp. 8AM]
MIWRNFFRRGTGAANVRRSQEVVKRAQLTTPSHRTVQILETRRRASAAGTTHRGEARRWKRTRASTRRR